jgi:septal ring factor EnvC (AmiA/AmiB activator)
MLAPDEAAPIVPDDLYEALDAASDLHECWCCGRFKPGTDYTLSAIRRRHQRPSDLLCSECRRAKAAKRDPMAQRISWKRAEIKRQRAVRSQLVEKIDAAAGTGWEALAAQATLIRNQRELARLQQQIERHEAELQALLDERRSRDAAAV